MKIIQIAIDVAKVLLVIVVITSFSFIFFNYYEIVRKSTLRSLERDNEWSFSNSIPDWDKQCIAASDEDREFYSQAYSIFERSIHTRSENYPVGWIEIGVRQFLSIGSRRENIGDDGKRSPPARICPPPDMYRMVGELITLNNGIRGRPVEYDLRLFALIDEPSDYIVAGVAAVAFNKTPQESGIFPRRDIRPYARTVLASFGQRALPYLEQAEREVGGNSPMATGAAQVMAASGNAGAMEKIEKLIQDTLSQYPPDKVIPRQTKFRLYELSYGIFFGEDAVRYAHLIEAVMSRKVESAAHPFGLIEHYPKQLCPLLERIKGADALAKFPYCTDPKVSMDQ